MYSFFLNVTTNFYILAGSTTDNWILYFEKLINSEQDNSVSFHVLGGVVLRMFYVCSS